MSNLLKQFIGTVVLLCLAGISSVALAEKPLTTVADLRYGVVLYEYFQGNHFESLSELMLAKEKGGIKGHKDNPDLIEGSLKLAYGMDQQAGEIYSEFLNESRPEEVRNAAWFYLSKIRYQRGQYEAVKESLAKITNPSRDLIDEIQAMEIQLLLREQKYDEAQERLNQLASKNISGNQFQYWRPYLNFNIGAIYARLERMAEARVLFDKVAKEKLSDNVNFHPEQFSLYDKAFTASGYSYFEEENYEKAIAAFGEVRQSAPLANDALLGFGWAKARSGDYQGALAPWLLLSKKPLADDAVQESLLAIPYAYLQLGDITKALESYAYAEQVFIDQLNHIDDAGSTILGQNSVELFNLDNFEATYSWLVPENNYLVTPASRYLLPLYSLNRFQNSVQTLADLHRINRRLEAWKISLDAYDDLMDYRLDTFRRQSQPEGYQEMTDEFATLKTQRDQLAATLSQARQERDVFLLLDEDQKDLLDMVESGERNIQTLSTAGEDVEEETAWIKRYRGMLLWSANLDFDDKLWALESQLKEIDAALASSQSTNQKINTLLTDAPDIATAKTKISNYAKRVDAVLNENRTVMAGIEEGLREQMYAALALQRQRVQFYLGEARLAVAQLYDNEYLKRAKE